MVLFFANTRQELNEHVGGKYVVSFILSSLLRVKLKQLDNTNWFIFSAFVK